MKISYYDVLGITENATQDEIKKAYKTLAKKHHPDTGGDQREFESLKKAYDTLSDKEKRAMYDEHGVDDDEFNKRINSALNLFMEAMQRNPDDIKEEIEGIIDRAKNDLKDQQRGINNEIEKLEKIKARIKKRPKGKDFIKEFLDNQISMQKTRLEDLQRTKEGVESLFSLFGEYEFDIVKKKERTEWHMPDMFTLGGLHG